MVIRKKNLAKISQLIQQNSNLFNLIVLPFNSLIGENVTKDNYKKYAESSSGDSVQKMSALAKQYKTYLMFSLPELYNGHYYETAMLLDPNGKIIGTYRKSHLNAEEKRWATPGNQLPVFNTQIGRIAIVLNDEARVPELSDMYALKRADIILVAAAYTGNYAGKVEVPQKLLVTAYPKETMFIWYNMAKYAQAYVLVANYIGGSKNAVGGSGMYSLDPEVGFYPPLLATGQKDQAFDANFITLGNSSVWQNQQRLIVGRRDDVALPLTLESSNACFKQWQLNKSAIKLCE